MEKHCKCVCSFGPGEMKISRKRVSSIAMKTVTSGFPRINVPTFTLKVCQMLGVS